MPHFGCYGAWVKSESERGPIGAWLVSERERLHLSAAEVALRADIPEASYRGIEAGRWIPNSTRLRVLEKAVGSEAPDITKEPPPEWATDMEGRLTEVLLANQKIFVETMATYFAQLGVERVLADQPPAAPPPGTRESSPEQAEPK